MPRVRLSNSNDIVADSIQVYNSGAYINVGNYLSNMVTAADLLLKADKTTTYTMAATDTLLSGKANTGTSYTIAQSDTNYALKANQATTYTMTATDTLLSGKANTGASYTIAQSDTNYLLKANQATTYTMTATDTLLSGKANTGASYTIAQSDTNYLLKANQATTYTKTETDTALGLKATQATTYTKTETDTALALKMNSSGTYTRTSIDNSLALKADLTTTYTKTAVDTSLALKSDLATTYTKTAVDTALALKQALLTSTSTITVSTISCISLSATSLLGAISCGGDLTIAGVGTFGGVVSATGFYSGSSNAARFYHYNYGATSAAIVQHSSQLQLAVSGTVPPLSTEVIMAMGTFTGVTVNKVMEAKAGLNVTGGDVTVTNNIYANGDVYSPSGKTFYSTNVANTALWDARIRLGFSINDAIRLYAGPTGIALYQHADNGGAQIVIFQSTDKKAVFYGNITTQSGGSVSASTFTTLSDQRVKTDIVDADLEECERLVKTISPKGYERTDYASGRKFGYIAQDWHNQVSNDFISVISEYEDIPDEDPTHNRTLYAIDMLPIVATIHGALKVALNKIELLEARVALLEGV